MTTTIAKGRLKSFVERVERLQEEAKGLSGDIREIFVEAKGEGFDTRIIKQVIKLRAMDRAARDERDALIDLYMAALEPEAPAAARPQLVQAAE